MTKDEVFNFIKTKNVFDEDLELLNLWLKDRSKIFFGFFERGNFEITNDLYFYCVYIKDNIHDKIEIKKGDVWR